jgi:hypothetical protein
MQLTKFNERKKLMGIAFLAFAVFALFGSQILVANADGGNLLFNQSSFAYNNLTGLLVNLDATNGGMYQPSPWQINIQPNVEWNGTSPVALFTFYSWTSGTPTNDNIEYSTAGPACTGTCAWTSVSVALGEGGTVSVQYASSTAPKLTTLFTGSVGPGSDTAQVEQDQVVLQYTGQNTTSGTLYAYIDDANGNQLSAIGNLTISLGDLNYVGVISPSQSGTGTGLNPILSGYFGVTLQDLGVSNSSTFDITPIIGIIIAIVPLIVVIAVLKMLMNMFDKGFTRF